MGSSARQLGALVQGAGLVGRDGGARALSRHLDIMSSALTGKEYEHGLLVFQGQDVL